MNDFEQNNENTFNDSTAAQTGEFSNGSDNSEETKDRSFDDSRIAMIDSDDETENNQRTFSAEYDRNSPARMTLSHIKSKIFATGIIFEKIPDDKTAFELLKEIDGQNLPADDDNAVFDFYSRFGKDFVSETEGYLIPEGKTWRDVVPESDIAKAFAKLLYVVAAPRLVVQKEGELYDPLAPVPMDVKFFDNSGEEVAKEISFKPVTRTQLKEFKYIKLDKPNPDALASHAKKNVLDRIYNLAKEIFHSANYIDIPAWHLTQAAMQYLQIEQDQSGKF